MLRLLAALLWAAPGASLATTVVIQTALGDMQVELFDTAAPLTVANFLAYAKSGAYAGSVFHRSVPGFIIQGGGFKDTLAAIASSPPVANEFKASNLRGTIAMAKLGSNPNSATNQWFINLANNAANLDAQNGGFTVFGQVLGNGMQVADAIAALSRVNAGGAFTDLPVTSVPADNVLRRENLVLVKAVAVLPAAATPLVLGWNLIGSGTAVPIYLPASFGDTSKVASVWKWVAASGKWAFYTPLLTGQTLTDYAADKGYEVLTSVAGGEGFWVNAKVAFSAPLPQGAPVLSTSFQNLTSGFNLIATGDNKTPSQFNIALGPTPLAEGVIPLNLTTLWAWDAAQSNWYFYAPSLDKSGGLTAFIVSKSYLDFGARVLDPATGFWVNRP